MFETVVFIAGIAVLSYSKDRLRVVGEEKIRGGGRARFDCCPYSKIDCSSYTNFCLLCFGTRSCKSGGFQGGGHGASHPYRLSWELETAIARFPSDA